MSKLVVHSFSVSLDGYAAGLNQDLENPIGVGGLQVFQWFFPTRTFQRMHRNADGETSVDDYVAARGFENIGAFILGRNMFGPVRGDWNSWPEEWRGWWGDEPPYHTPVFVLTHHARVPLEMKGGTTFHFVTDGIHSALEQAKKAAGDKDVRVGGGVSTIRQYLSVGLIDELHLAIVQVLLGEGEHLLGGLNLPALGYECAERLEGERATHVTLQKRVERPNVELN